MPWAVIAATLAGLGGDPAVTLKSAVEVTGNVVRVRDLVAGEERLDPAIASQIVLRLPRATARAELAPEAIAALLRRRVPAIRVIVPEGLAPVILSGTPPVAPTAPAAICYETVRDVAPGPIAGRDLRAVPCEEPDKEHRIRYDGLARTAVSGRPLAAGTYLGRLIPATGQRVARGAHLTLRSVAGPVTVERSVTTLQAGQSGRRVFVRDEAGAVFAAPLALAPGDAQ